MSNPIPVGHLVSFDYRNQTIKQLRMPVFVNTGFKGFYPVGVSAVVVAANVDLACELLNAQLVARGLEPSAKPEQFTEIDSTQAGAFVLNDGNY